MMKASLFLLLSLLSLVSSEDDKYNDPMYGARKEWFQIETEASAVSRLKCVDLGARCVFVRSDYSSHHFGTGQETENEEGAVWAYTSPDAVLSLGNCVEDSCVVNCNANCTCAFTTADNDVPRPCQEIAAPPPSAPEPVKTIEPAKQCPRSLYTQYCPELMSNALPAGVTEGQYDCFNFCGGIWASTCDFEGNCGPLDCSNKTAAGTINGIVQGCTEADIQEGTNTSGSTSSSVLSWTMVTGALLFVAGVVA